MMAGTHMETGAVAWTALAIPAVLATQLGVLPAEPTAVAVAVGYPLAIAAALGPDIDHPGSKISRFVFAPLGPFRKYAVRLIAGPLGGHRGGTHTLWAVLIVGAVFGLVAPWVGLAVGVGWAAHIYGDCHTKHGVAVLWPASTTVLRLGRVRTGSPLGEGWWRLKQGGIGVVLAFVLALLVLVDDPTRAGELVAGVL